MLLLDTKQVVVSRGGLNCWGCKTVEELLAVERPITKAVPGSKLLTNEISKKKNIFFYLSFTFCCFNFEQVSHFVSRQYF